MNTQNKRERLVDAAAALFHRQGTNVTSLADIAKHADIPIGNVYYYFKTKEELALAAIARRKEQFAAAYQLLDENFDNPRQRLIEALKYFDNVRTEYAKYGCPIGRVIEDANAEKDAVAKMAAEILSDFVEWGARQFERLGHGEQAKTYATHLMTGIQGAAVMAKALDNPQIISDEIARLTQWLESLPNKRISIGKAGLRSADAA